MTYNGFELVEMTTEDWNGKSREMLVWDDDSPSLYKKLVIGYHPHDNCWMSDNGDFWHHCADIPNEKQNIDKMFEVLNAYKDGKKIECRFKDRTKRDSWSYIKQPDWNWARFEYRVKN